MSFNNDDDLKRLLRKYYQPAAASSDFKEKLHKLVTESDRAIPDARPSNSWLKPLLWVSVGAVATVALIVLGITGAAMLQKKTINIRVPMQQQQSWFDQEIGAPRPQQQKPMMPQRQATPPKKQQPERINKPPPAKKGKAIGDWFKEKLNPKPPPRYRFRGRKNKT